VGFIKAYDVASGNIKWEKTLTLGASSNGFGTVVINGDIALVRGAYSSISGNPPIPTVSKSFIRAYQVDTGELLPRLGNRGTLGQPRRGLIAVTGLLSPTLISP